VLGDASIQSEVVAPTGASGQPYALWEKQMQVPEPNRKDAIVVGLVLGLFGAGMAVPSHGFAFGDVPYLVVGFMLFFTLAYGAVGCLFLAIRWVNRRLSKLVSSDS